MSLCFDGQGTGGFVSFYVWTKNRFGAAQREAFRKKNGRQDNHTVAMRSPLIFKLAAAV